MKTVRNALVAAVILSVPAFAETGKSDTKMTTDATGKDMISKVLPTDEKGLMERLHDDNQREVMLGQLAQQKAQTQGAKDVASMMVQDHQQADKDLMAMAQKKGMKIGKPTPANEMERKHMAEVEAATAHLKTLDGVAFDSVYLANMVADHDHAVLMVSAGQQKFASNTEVAGMLQQLQPKLQQHRDHAYQALGQVKVTQGGMATGGSGMGSQTGTSGGSMGQTGAGHDSMGTMQNNVGMSGKAGGRDGGTK